MQPDKITNKPFTQERLYGEAEINRRSQNSGHLICSEDDSLFLPSDAQEKQACNFSQLTTLWRSAMQVKQKITTRQKYEFLLEKHIIPHLGTCEISDLTTSKLNSFIEEKLQNGRLDNSGGLSPSYARSIAILINSILRFADMENISMGHQIVVYKPTLVKKEVEVLSISEQMHLEACLFSDLTPTGIGIIISLNTGLRLGEICALSWDDICWENHTLTVRGTVVRLSAGKKAERSGLRIDTPKTPSSRRQIPIPAKLWASLRQLYCNSAGKYILTGTDVFISPRTYEYRFHRLLEWCGIRTVNYHVLRHTFATRCVEAGMDMKTLSELLGHASVATTMNTYVHSSIEHKRVQIEKMTALF